MSKYKKILIPYFNNGDLKKTVELEILWDFMLNKNFDSELEVENRTSNFRTARLKDGTIIKAVPIKGDLSDFKGERATHVFMSNDSPIELIQIVKTIVVDDGNYENYNTENLPKEDRIFTYKVENNKLSIDKYNK